MGKQGTITSKKHGICKSIENLELKEKILTSRDNLSIVSVHLKGIDLKRKLKHYISRMDKNKDSKRQSISSF